MIDTHQHYWTISRGGYAWIMQDNAILYQDYKPDDLSPILAKQGITSTIAVQADDNEAETHFLLSIAAQTPSLIGVIGWVDLENPTVTENINRLSANPYFLGIRPMIQDIAQLDWMLKPELSSGIKQLVELDLTFDALVQQKHLPYLNQFLNTYPDLRVVIDHFAKPEMSSHSFQNWADEMSQAGEYPNTYCKLSGLLTEAKEGMGYDDFAPYIEHTMQAFGYERLLFGSDWPVINLAGKYEDWMSILKRFFADNLPILEQQIGVENVKKAYPRMRK